MASKFHTFAEALEALARQHGVFLTGETGRIIVWDREADKPAVLFDRTHHHDAPKPRPLPDYFETLVEAKAHAGFVGHEIGPAQAERLHKAHPGSAVIPIGAYKARAWVVVMPEKA